MRNTINLPDGIDANSFQQQLRANLKNNLTKNTINNLASLLAIDYCIRSNSMNMLDHIESCITRLQKHIKNKVVTDDSFSSSMGLFTVAITPQEKKHKDTFSKTKHKSIEASNEESPDENNKKEEKQVSSTLVNLSPEELFKDDLHADFSIADKAKSAIKATIRTIVASCFPNTNQSEKHSLSVVLDSCSEIYDISEILELVNSDPALFKEIADKALSEKTTREDIAKFVIKHINKILHQQQKISKAKSNIRSWSSKLTLAACISVAAGIGFVVTGPALPILLIPTIIASSKISGKIAELVHEKIISASKSIKDDQELLNHLKSTTTSSLAINKTNKLVEISNSKSFDLQQARAVVQNIKPHSYSNDMKGRHRY